jgi:drug/metabolite transporter (DMT)-like permease
MRESSMSARQAPSASRRLAPTFGGQMRILAIVLMCGAMVFFTGLDTSSKWLGRELPIAEIVWARYVGSTVIALAAAGPWLRPAALISKRSGMQALRSLLLLGATGCVVAALRSLQLAESATISFLTPIFVALAAGPLLGERVGRERMIAIGVSFLGVLIATRPGMRAFQPAVLIAVLGVVFNAGYVIATRKLAAVDSSPTTLVWTQAAGIALLTPLLPWIWVTPPSLSAWAVIAGLSAFGASGHALLIAAHRYAPAPVLTPFSYTQLIWMIFSGYFVFGDIPPVATLIGAAIVIACGASLLLREGTKRAGNEA